MFVYFHRRHRRCQYEFCIISIDFYTGKVFEYCIESRLPLWPNDRPNCMSFIVSNMKIYWIDAVADNDGKSNQEKKKKLCLPIHVWIASRKCTMFVVGGSSTSAPAIRSRMCIFYFQFDDFFFLHLLRFRLWKTNLFISKRMSNVWSFVTFRLHVCLCANSLQSACTNVFVLLYRAQQPKCEFVCERRCVVKITRRAVMWVNEDENFKFRNMDRTAGDYVGVAMRWRKKWRWRAADRHFRRALGFGYQKTDDVPRIGRFLWTQIEKYKYWV